MDTRKWQTFRTNTLQLLLLLLLLLLLILLLLLLIISHFRRSY